MLKMANQQIQRIGAEMVKVLFMIEVKKIEFADDVKSDYSKSTLSLSFERGGKLASTKDRILEPEKNILYVNETLSLIVTLYKQSNSHGKFQEKLGKLTLRQLKKNKRIVSSNNDYKGVGGSIKLPIHKLVSELSTGGTKDMVYPIDAGKDILVHVRLSARLIGDANDDDDMSMISDSSNHSGLATNSGHLLSSGSAGGNDDDDGSNNNIGQDNAHRQPPKINGSQSKLQTSSSNNDLSESANGSPDRKIASRRVTNPPVGPHLHAHGSSVEQRAEFLQLMSKLHDRDAEIARLQERLQEQERDHRAQILALRTELGVAQGELKR